MRGPVHETLVSVEQLHANLDAWVTIDCRFDLNQPAAGREAYLQAHVPGAVYAHLDDDLSGPPRTDAGRHPLPSPQALENLFSRCGIDAETQVVAYDAHDGAVAARVWWMLRYMGHDAVAVLDGGWQAWAEGGLPAAKGEERRQPARFRGRPVARRLATVDDIPSARLLIDARNGARYRGESEPLDPVAGHVPGARSYFFRRNNDETGRWLAAQRIRSELDAVLGDTPASDAVYYCGSGVTACQVILATQHAGLPEGRLYVGSWSEWCTDPARPVATGADPGVMPLER